MRLYQINKKRVFFKTNHFSDKLNPYNLSKIFSKFVYNRLKLYSCEIKLGKTKNNYRSLTQINKFTCKKFNLHIFLKLQYLLRQIELKIDCAFPNLSNFRPGNKTLCENWKKLSFILKYSHMNEKSHPIIVYYAPRKKRLGQSISRVNCHPSRRRGWQTRDVGWPILLPWSVYFFSPHGA